MAHLGNYLPSPGSAVWRRDVSSSLSHEHGVSRGSVVSLSDYCKVRHVVIRDAEIWEEPAPYVVYRIDVLTENDHWYLFRRYSQFHFLHKKLVKLYGVNRDLLPPKKLSGNLSKQLIDKRRKLLERYLQKIIHSEPQISRSEELKVFLDVPTHNVIKVADILTRHLYLHGDHLLEEATPISLSVNEMYAITRRLKLPRDAIGIDSDDVATDPAHLYSFVHQLQRLRIIPPPLPCSVCCMSFDMGPFRSLQMLKLERVPMSQVSGLVLIQQHLEKLSVQRTLHSLQELLVESVEEKRDSKEEGSIPHSPLESVDTWRLAANAKLAGSRVVVQPWHRLHTLILSHNLLAHLDNSLQLLPVLRELNLSHNKLEVLRLQFLCLPSLEKLNLSHNQIHTIEDNRKVLERITHLSLSHNRLGSLEGIVAFVGVCVLNLSFNALSSTADLGTLVRLRRLNVLGMAGNPITSSSACRILLLAKFMQKSKMISLDGLEASLKEQAKIKTYNSKYGADPDLWPLAKSLASLEASLARHHSQPRPQARRPRPLSTEVAGSPGQRPGSTTPTSPPHVDLSWQVKSDLQNESSYEPNVPHPSSNLYGNSSWSQSPNPSPGSARANPGASWDRFSFPSSSNDSSEQSLVQQGGSFTPQLLRPQKRAPDKRHSFSAMSDEERFSAGVACHTGSRRSNTRGHPSRSEPDGQSDASSASPDPQQQQQQQQQQRQQQQLSHQEGMESRGSMRSVVSLPPPPSTPVQLSSSMGEEGVVAPPHIVPPSKIITPTTIQTVLDALEAIHDKDTPISITPLHPSSDTSRQSPILSEEVTSALTAWISSQNPQGTASTNDHTHSSQRGTPHHVVPPPSTPNQTPIKEGSEVIGSSRQGISAGDLITALSTLKVSRDELVPSSHESLSCSVPSCTPNEGLSEWAKLGITPDEVIQALSALTIQQEEEEEGDGHRVCSQREREAVSSEPSVELDHNSPPLDTTHNYVCLFPETNASSAEEEEEAWGHGSSAHDIDPSHLEEDDDDWLRRHHVPTSEPRVYISAEKEFAELDPYFASGEGATPPSTLGSYTQLQPSPKNPSLEVGQEVGVDATTGELGVKLEEEKVKKEGGTSSSPLDSVLYSDSQY